MHLHTVTHLGEMKFSYWSLLIYHCMSYRTIEIICLQISEVADPLYATKRVIMQLMQSTWTVCIVETIFMYIPINFVLVLYMEYTPNVMSQLVKFELHIVL